jgi:hypothetical protein
MLAGMLQGHWMIKREMVMLLKGWTAKGSGIYEVLGYVANAWLCVEPHCSLISWRLQVG